MALTKEETATPREKRPWFAVTRALGCVVVKIQILRSRVIANVFCEAISSGTGTHPILERVPTKEETATIRKWHPSLAVTRGLEVLVHSRL